MTLPSVEEQREALRDARFDAPRRHRILFVGRAAQGPTDVVASLERALEAVGHTVFHLDTLRHQKILDASSGAKGGYGPIYLDVDAIAPVLDTFAPQVMIVCAGGIVLTEEAAAQVRARGIVTIGVTLSDPDVQPSVIDHVGRFDYHTTNAALSVDRYEEAGIHNTFLMPFGIDRSYILRDVPEDPSMTADAICIGHAAGRTDRHEVMLELANHLDVKVYGAGWPFAGSVPVRGDQLLQAAKGGTFHINFPGTRAGYTNVKCGVFESVGTGSILCTGEFDEMGRLFEYGTEIVGYSDAQDLAAKLTALKADPERLEEMRRRSFARLIADHLYERRWNTLFEQIYADLEAEQPRIGAERAAEVREILATSQPLPRTVLISGYFGSRNRGDDLLLDSLARQIEAEVPDAHVVVAASGPKQVELLQGRPAFNRLDPIEANQWAARATTVVVGPGGLWHDYTIHRAGGVAGLVTGARVSPAHLAQLPAMVRAHGGSYHVFGMGVGPLKDPAAKATVRFSGLLAESVNVRDLESRRLLESIDGWSTPVEVSPDVAYGLTLPHVEPVPSEAEGGATGGYLVVNVRPWDRDPGAAHQILAAAFEVAAEHGLEVVGLPMQPQDEVELRAWTPDPEGPAYRVVGCEASLEEFTSTLAGATAVVAMRLHTNLIAHRLGKACVGIAYDPKLVAHFTELGREDFVVPLPVDRPALAAAIRTAVNEGGIGEESLAHIAELEDQARAAVKALAARIAASPVQPMPLGELPPERKVDLDMSAKMPEQGRLDLALAQVVGGNLTDPSRTVGVSRSRGRYGDRINLDSKAPRRGDFAAWTTTLPATPGEGLRVEMWLRSKYTERENRRGRLAYQVLLDGKKLFQVDVAAWQERNTVWVATVPERDEVELTVRIVALRDCEPWGWGRAAAVTIEAARQVSWPAGSAGPVWGASVPQPRGAAAAAAVSRQEGGRLVGRARRVAGQALRKAGVR